MTLDARVRCTCIKERKAKPHPLPDRLAFDEINEPVLTGKPTLDDSLVHDRWFDESCEHGGYIVSEYLGNIAMIAHVRDLVGGLEREHGLSLPILKEKVIYNGVHAGDHLSLVRAVQLMKEVETVLQSGDVVEDIGKKFFAAVKRLCEASIRTRNPIVFT
jgi:hypothetical protein